MKIHRIAMSGAVLTLGLAFAAAASAQTGLTITPNPLTMTAQGGGLSMSWVTVTNHGPGFASNLAVVPPTNMGPTHGGLTVIADTCTGATLAQNGTCTVRFEYEAPCFTRKGYADQWYVAITSAQFPVMNEHVTGVVGSYACI